jgi:hypothetical protein
VHEGVMSGIGADEVANAVDRRLQRARAGPHAV